MSPTSDWGSAAPQLVLLLLLPLAGLLIFLVLACCSQAGEDQPKAKRSRARLDFLTGCRFFLSNWIVAGHYLPYGDDWSLLDSAHRRGNAAVCAFIFLSGFVTHWAYAEKDVAQSRALTLQYYARRLGRVILTSYCAMTVQLLLGLAISSETDQTDVFHLLRCFTFIENYQMPLTGEILWCPVGPIWTISALMASWLIYPLTSRAIVWLGDRFGAKLLALALFLSGLQLGAFVVVFVGQGFWLSVNQHDMGYFWPPSQLLDFVIGCAVAEAAQRQLLKQVGAPTKGREDNGALVPAGGTCPACYSMRAAAVDLCTVLMLVIVILTPGSGWREGWEPLYDHGLIPLYAVATYAATSRAEKDPQSLLERLLSHKALVSLGVYSFQVFLFQSPLRAVFWLLALDPRSGCANFLAYAVVLWILSGVYYEYIETPFVAWLRKATVIGGDAKTETATDANVASKASSDLMVLPGNPLGSPSTASVMV